MVVAMTRGGFGRVRRRRAPSVLLGFLLLAFVLHVLGLAVIAPWLPDPSADPRTHTPLRLVVTVPEPEAPPEPEEIPEPVLDGQLVDLPKPLEEQKPEESEYLAEHDVTVEQEMRSPRFEINPEVLSDMWSRDRKMQQEDLFDLNVDKPSTGAKVGNDRFDPDRDGNLSALPSPWARTNKDGLQDPVPASHTSSAQAGAPNNDLVDEEAGDRLALNAREYLYAAYLQRIRRLVNFYWNQNLENLPSSTPIVKAASTTVVEAVLDEHGRLDLIRVTSSSGVNELDEAVVQAFHLANPFPNPPEGLISPDGRVYLPTMGFTVRVGPAQMRYQGVDPRAGVQFPGVLKSPR